MNIETFFDSRTYTLTYVVWDPETRDAVVIDPVLDYDPVAVRVFDESVTEVLQYVKDNNLNLRWVLETHAHADHLSSSQLIKDKLGTPVAIGEHITTVQGVFKDVFDLGEDFATDGSQFDRLLKHGETFQAGSLAIKVLHTPGHTPACVSYLIDDALFTGDALFMPDFGTGRCDFPGGSAEDLYNSVANRIYALPESTRVFVGHDYQPGGRELAWETSVGESKRSNKQLRGDTDEATFVKFRSDRDATLNLPKLIFQSVQVNVNAGQLPAKADNGHRYLKLPLNLFD